MAKLTGKICIVKTETYDVLTIAEDAVLSAPAGKQLTLTVDGVQMNIVPGTYTGDIRLTVTEDFGRAGGMGPLTADTGFTAAVRGEDGKIAENRSVLAAVQGGTFENGTIRGVTVVSKGNEFGGFDLENGEYTLEDVSIFMDGYGGSDFSGQGVALTVAGDARVTADRLHIQTKGVIRNGLVVTGTADVLLRDSEITCLGATEEEYQATAKVKKGMLNVPWQLGLRGNCRATNILKSGSVTYENCKISSWGWGVLSSDDISEADYWEDFKVHITAKDSEVNVLGPSGYAAFCTGPSLHRYESTTIRTSDYVAIHSDGYASAEYKNCNIYSRRFGVMSIGNQGGQIRIEDSCFDTENAVFLIKSCYPQIDVSGSTLSSRQGIILQLMDNDDPSYNPAGNALDSTPPVKIPEHDVTRVNFEDFYLFSRVHVEEKPTDVQARFSDMTLTGDLFNGITNRCPVGMYFPDGSNPFETMFAEPELQAPTGAPGGFPPSDAGGMPPMGAGGPPAGFPGGDMPGGFPGGDMPGGSGPASDVMMSFVNHPSTNNPVNLAVTLDRVQYTGRASAVLCRHAVKVADPAHYDQIGVVTSTPAPVVNNGVILTLEGGSSWTVTGDCYLSALHIGPDSSVNGLNGQTVRMTVDGAEIPVAPGDYAGDIRISLNN